MPTRAQPLLGDPGTYRRFLSDTASGLLFTVAVAAAVPEEWVRRAVLTVVGRPDAPIGQPLELSGGELATLGAVAVVSAVVLGPLINAASYTLAMAIDLLLGWLKIELMTGRFVPYWRRRICQGPFGPVRASDAEQVYTLLNVQDGNFALVSEQIAQIHVPHLASSLDRYNGIYILTRVIMFCAIIHAGITYSVSEPALSHATATALLAIVVWYIGATVEFYSFTRHAAVLLALAAMTGDRELLDEDGRLPDWFRQNPARWLRRLMQHYPLRPTDGGATMTSVPPSSSDGR